MRFLSNLLFRLRALLRPRTMERELEDEFSFHLEMETRKLAAQGLLPEAAAREARLRFGYETAERERARDNWGIGLARDFLADLRQAFRQLRRRPAFSFHGNLTLALGLGATAGLSRAYLRWNDSSRCLNTFSITHNKRPAQRAPNPASRSTRYGYGAPVLCSGVVQDPARYR